ncbi:patatin-like phospholipase family protein [Kordiimonas sp.]|uniref:patatin-like phospholipase family protein n=1 Tax=Kordiimonas sp. TaxID=1970157 RepID=UPI003A8E0D1A
MKIGLALGGGAGLGWAHIGVVRVLEEAGIHPDVISGTSIGSIVGACVAADILDELEQIARDVKIRDMLAMSEFGFKQGGLIGVRKIEKRLREHFGVMTIEEMPKPFVAIAADLISGERVVLKKGDVATALMASSAVPGVLPPVATGRMLLADGGLIDPIPVSAARELGADIVIAVDLQGDYAQRAVKRGFEPDNDRAGRAPMRTARLGIALLLRSLSRVRLEADKPDHIIAPAIGHIDVMDFRKANELIALGRLATEAVLPDILAGLGARGYEVAAS